MTETDKTMENFHYHSKIYFEGVNKPNELFISHDQVYSILVERDTEITQLKADLAKFGGHTAECASRKTISYGSTIVPKCDCGYEKAEERWK